MKATINGVAVEGTPQEIMEYQKLQAERKSVREGYKYPWAPDIKAATTGGNVKRECTSNGPCYCTGTCMGEQETTSVGQLMRQYVALLVRQ